MLNKTVHVFSLSAASLSVCLLATAFIVFGSIWSLSYNNGSFFEQFLGTGSFSSQAANNFQTNVNVTQENLNSNKVIDRLPTTIFWLLIGLVVYTFIEGTAKLVKGLYQFDKEVNFVHVNRRALLSEILKKVLLKMLFAAAWAVYALLFFRYIVNYASACMHIAARNALSGNGLIYTLIAFILWGVGTHIHIIFLRLFLLRTRISGET